MSEHTLGPWKIERHYDSGYKNISAQKHTALAQVVWCMEDEDRSPECEANAHLIAAAPELLDALCYLLEASSGQGPHEQWLAAMDQARAAIAKAEGERMVRPSPQEPDSFTVEAARAAIAKALGE